MSVQPYPIQAFRDNKWVEVSTESLVPGDVVSIQRTKPDSGIPCDLLLLKGTCIVNEAMLSGESTPLLKESVELREGTDRLDMNGGDRNNVLFSGTKAIQVSTGGEEAGSIKSESGHHLFLNGQQSKALLSFFFSFFFLVSLYPLFLHADALYTTPPPLSFPD